MIFILILQEGIIMKTYGINFIKLIAFALVILLICQYRILSAYAVDDGWIEVKVNVPENFSDQIYIQFQEIGKVDKVFYENFVQLLPENEYIGRLKLTSGNYEITCKSVYENPLIYNLELDGETECPIIVKSGIATRVVLNCTVVPIEDLPEIEGEYPQEILDMAQKASDGIALKPEGSDTIPESSIFEEDVTNPGLNEETEVVKIDPLKNILQGFFSTIIFISISGGVIHLIYWSKEKRE